MLQAIGWLYWCGYLAEVKAKLLTVALQFLVLVYRSSPDAVPDEVRNLFDTTPVATSPASLAEWGMKPSNRR